MADIGLSPWEAPVKVTVSNINFLPNPDEAVFDTGATHDVSNLNAHFI